MHDLHGRAGLVVGIALVLLASDPSMAEDRKPETPEHAHELRVTCAAATAAAVAEADMTSSGSEKERTEARTLMSETRDEALRSGERIGRSAAQVSEAIDRSRAGILERFAQVAGDSDALAKEKAELGRVVIACALVEVIERRDAQKGVRAPGSQGP